MLIFNNVNKWMKKQNKNAKQNYLEIVFEKSFGLEVGRTIELK